MGTGQAGKQAEQQAAYTNQRRRRGENGESILRRRSELIECSFVRCYETGDRRRGIATCDFRLQMSSPSLPPHLRRTKAGELSLNASFAFVPFRGGLWEPSHSLLPDRRIDRTSWFC
jgi:hypothetical protein